MKRLVSTVAVFALLLSGALVLTHCSDESKEYQLSVVVVADNDVRVANALVRLYVPVENSFIDWYEFTNEKGEVNYTFANEVVVEIVASKGSFVGCGFAQVKAGPQSTTVEILPYGTDNNGCPETTP